MFCSGDQSAAPAGSDSYRMCIANIYHVTDFKSASMNASGSFKDETNAGQNGV